MPPEGSDRVLAGVAVVLAAYGALFGGAEILRRWGVAGEQTRSLVHVGSAILALGLPYLFGSPWPVVAMAIGFAGAMVASHRLGLLGSIHDVPRRTVGAAMFPLGIAAAYAITGGEVPGYPIAVLALGLGDPAAALTGRRIARSYGVIWGARRSLEGSVAACLVSSGVTVSVLYLVGGASAPMLLATPLAVGVAVALAEATSPLGLDNVAIPVAAAIVVGPMGTPSWTSAVLAALTILTLGGVAWDRPVVNDLTGRNGRAP